VEREDLEASVAATTAAYTSYLEAAIRRYPDQWNWLGLPNRNGKLSRAELALRRKERMQEAAARDVAVTRRTGTGV
jgi:hypothetical protein